MSPLDKCVRLMLIVGASFLGFVDVVGLEENEEVVDDFDAGTATYWQVWPTSNSSTTTFWHFSTHGEPLPPGIDIVRPPSVLGDGFLEVFPLSDNVAQIYSSVFDLLPGATVELTYWNSDGTYPLRHAVLLVYNEFKQMDDETGTKPPLRSVLVYRAPLLTDEFSGWRTDLIDLKITEPSKIQIRIDGSIWKTNETGLAVTKIAIKNGVEMSTTSSTSFLTTSSTSSTTGGSSSTSTEASSTIGSTLSTSTELTSTSSSLSIPSSPSTSSTVTQTTIFSSTISSTISTSGSNPSFVPSTATTSSSLPSTSLDSTDSSVTSTLPPPSGAMTANQLRNVLIGAGVAILLLLFICLLVVCCYKRHRRRAYLIENRQLETGVIRQVKQLDDYPILPYKTDYDSPSISSTNSTQSP